MIMKFFRKPTIYEEAIQIAGELKSKIVKKVPLKVPMKGKTALKVAGATGVVAGAYIVGRKTNQPKG